MKECSLPLHPREHVPDDGCYNRQNICDTLRKPILLLLYLNIPWLFMHSLVNVLRYPQLIELLRQR